MTQEFDVVVVGSGGAGLAAALAAAHQRLSVVVVEKAPHYGGSTARSGGGVWIPNNDTLVAAGIDDSYEEARRYLASIVGDVVAPERIDTYLQRGPEVFSFLTRVSPLEMRWVPGYSDYYPEAPGGRAHGRSVEPKPFDGKKLGSSWRISSRTTSKGRRTSSLTQADYRQIHLGLRNPRFVSRAIRVGGRWVKGSVMRQQLLARGQALVAMLRIGLQRADVPVWLNTPLLELTQEDGRVSGVVVRRDGVEEVVRARRGVILACRRIRAQRDHAQAVPARAHRHRVDRRVRRPTPVTASGRAEGSVPQWNSWRMRGGDRLFRCRAHPGSASPSVTSRAASSSMIAVSGS